MFKLVSQFFCSHFWVTKKKEFIEKELDTDWQGVTVFNKFMIHECCEKCRKQNVRELRELD